MIVIFVMNYQRMTVLLDMSILILITLVDTTDDGSCVFVDVL